MEHIAQIRREGLALLDAAEAAGLDAPVAACPGWDVSRLVRHVAKVWQRTAILVAEGLDAPPPPERFTELARDEAVLTQAHQVLDELGDALSGADPDTPCWNFTGTDLRSGFWRRRMVHESAVHRWDAEVAAGRPPSPVPAEQAVDGIDELLTVLLGVKESPDLTASYHLHCTDTEGEWLTVFSAGRPTTTREHAKGDVAVRGPASPLFFWAWNRQPADTEGLEAFGDPGLLAAWASIVP